MTLLSTYIRVTRENPCPVCAKPDWCLVSGNTPPSRAICARIASDRRLGEAGWIHRLRDDGWRPSRSSTRSIHVANPANAPNLDELAERYRNQAGRAAITPLALELGLLARSLVRLRIGWTGRCWAFPMTDASGHVRGIRLRLPDGRKMAVRGGREGLFMPIGLGACEPLLIAEGATDTAALLGLGFDVVGRPSCSGGSRLLVELVKARKPPAVTIVADADTPGQRGAAALATMLGVYCPDLRIITPPAKDARAWVNSGAGARDVCSAIAAASPRRLLMRVRRIGT